MSRHEKESPPTIIVVSNMNPAWKLFFLQDAEHSASDAALEYFTSLTGQ